MPRYTALVLLAALSHPADDPPKDAPRLAAAQAPAGPAFRLTVQQYEAERQPVALGEIIVSRGKVFYLETGSKEVIILDPAASTVRFLDLKLGLASELPFRELDAGLAANVAQERKVIEAHARAKSRAERIDAEMRRDQVEPRFQPTFDDASHTLRMSNASVQVEARGEPEDDPARLAAIVGAVTTLAKLRAYREPDDLRHLVQLEAITTLVGGRKLRPAEFTYLFRLAGPPEKYRQTYQLVEVTAEDREGLDQLEARFSQLRRVAFERYNRRIDPDAAK